MGSEPTSHRTTAPSSAAGSRLDRFLTGWLEPQRLSRARLQSLIEEGEVTVDGQACKAALRLRGGEDLRVNIPPLRPASVEAQDIPLTFLYEDEWIAVIDKPAHLVVHPARGAEEGTLVNALLYQIEDLSGIGGEERPGIVHRLDKDTSGVLVVAKSDVAHRALCDLFRVHDIVRRYRAIVRGHPPASGTWRSELGRSPRNRLKMISLERGGRLAITHFEVLEYLEGASLVELTLETGRTHQIRVHCSEAGFPVLGDLTYGGHWRRGLPSDARTRVVLEAVDRQLLHARELGFRHPADGRAMHFVAEPPPIFEQVRQALQVRAEPEVDTDAGKVTPAADPEARGARSEARGADAWPREGQQADAHSSEASDSDAALPRRLTWDPLEDR